MNHILIFDVAQVLYGRGDGSNEALFHTSELLLLGPDCSSWAQSGRDIVGGGHTAGAAFLMVGEVLGPVRSSHLSSSKGGSYGLSNESILSFGTREQLTSRYRPAWQPERLAPLRAARDGLFHRTQEQTIPRRIRLLCRWKGIVRAQEKYFSHGDREACKRLFLFFFFPSL